MGEPLVSGWGAVLPPPSVPPTPSPPGPGWRCGTGSVCGPGVPGVRSEGVNPETLCERLPLILRRPHGNRPAKRDVWYKRLVPIVTHIYV